jgi:ribosomal protein S6
MTTAEKKEYELAFLVRTEKEIEKILEIISGSGAEIVFHGPGEKISLSYPIKKETSAHFGYLHFALAPQKITSLTKELRMSPTLLRFLIVSPPFEGIKTKTTQKIKKMPQPATERKIEPLPLSNEALERKIEEILQE